MVSLRSTNSHFPESLRDENFASSDSCNPKDLVVQGKPIGVKGAIVFAFVGDDAPSDLSMWKFGRLITKTKFEINFDNVTQANKA